MEASREIALAPDVGKFASIFSAFSAREFVGFNCAVLPHAAGILFFKAEGMPNAVWLKNCAAPSIQTTGIDRCCLSDLRKSDTYSIHFSFRYLFRKKLPIFLRILFFVPGFVDVHVHLREPGFHIKTVKTGTLAAANGGMLRFAPCRTLIRCLTASNAERQLEIIRRDACIPVYPYGAITIGENGRELSDMDALAPYVVAFSDDGKGVQNERNYACSNEKGKKLHKIIAAHCEDNFSLVRGGCIHDGNYADRHSLPEYAVKANGALLHAILSLSVERMSIPCLPCFDKGVR